MNKYPVSNSNEDDSTKETNVQRGQPFFSVHHRFIDSYLKSLRDPVGEADGELLHLGNLQPLLLCLVLCASFHHHLQEREENS